MSAVELFRGVLGRARGSRLVHPVDPCRAEVRDDIAHDGQRVLVVVRQMIDHARFARMQVPAAERFGADFLARRGFHQRRPARKIVPCSRTITLSSLIAGT